MDKPSNAGHSLNEVSQEDPLPILLELDPTSIVNRKWAQVPNASKSTPLPQSQVLLGNNCPQFREMMAKMAVRPGYLKLCGITITPDFDPKTYVAQHFSMDTIPYTVLELLYGEAFHTGNYLTADSWFASKVDKNKAQTFLTKLAKTPYEHSANWNADTNSWKNPNALDCLHHQS